MVRHKGGENKNKNGLIKLKRINNKGEKYACANTITATTAYEKRRENPT